MGNETRKRAGWRVALVLAPLLAVAACDQVGQILEQFGINQQQQAPVVDNGPAPLASVAEADRAVAGAVQPASLLEASIVVESPKFVPGEILVGAKVNEEVAEAQGVAMSVFNKMLASEDVKVVEALDIAPEVLAKATSDAIVEATKDANVVLKRLGVEGEVEVISGGLVKIDLTGPEKANPLRYQEPAPADPNAPPTAEPAQAAVEPLAVEDTNLKCPRGVTDAQLEADLVLKTQCTLERLRASKQFDYVEKNYVVEVGFERWPPGSKPPAPKPAPTQPTSPTPGQPAPTTPTGPATLPNDPLLPLQWHYRGLGTGPDQSRGGAGFEPFWLGLKQTGSRAVRVAVIDTGIDKSHPDIAGSPNLAPGIDLISNWDRAVDGDGIDADANDPGDACRAGSDSSFHGTHVSGTVGAAITNDRKGVAGGAWNVTVVPVRALGKCGGELEDIINGIRWAAGLGPAEMENGTQLVNANPADIINMSLAVGIPCPASMQAAIDGAVARGVVVVVAAGNNATAAATYAPANCRNVVTVAANDARGALTFYSNFGPEVDIMAPGGDMWNDVDNDGHPDGVLSTKTQRRECVDPTTNQTASVCYYAYDQGTSMAAPHVAAALALLKSQYNLSGKQLEDLLLTRAVSPIGAGMCEIECARNPSATPVPGKPGVCQRACGRGQLNLALLAQAPAAPAGAAPATPRKR